MNYTTIQLCKLTGLSRQRIHALRKYSVKSERKLLKDVDYFYEDGNIYYTESAVSKLKCSVPIDNCNIIN